MAVVAWIVLALAAVLHLYIWWLESFAWTRPRTRAIFGMSPEQAAAMKPMAFNQGFYNLFLAIILFAGIAMRPNGFSGAGGALVAAGAGSMLLAAVVLVASDRGQIRAAVTQGALPALGLLALAQSA